MKEKGDMCILVGYSTQFKGYRVYNKRTRLIVESIHLRFNEIKEMAEMSVDNNTSGLVPQQHKASDYDNSGLTPQLQNVSPSANTTAPSKQDLDLLFDPLHDEFFTVGTSGVNKSSSPTDNLHKEHPRCSELCCTPKQQQPVDSSNNSLSLLSNSNLKKGAEYDIMVWRWKHYLEYIDMMFGRGLEMDMKIPTNYFSVGAHGCEVSMREVNIVLRSLPLRHGNQGASKTSSSVKNVAFVSQKQKPTNQGTLRAIEPSVSDDRSSECSSCQSNDSAGSIGTSSVHSIDSESEISIKPGNTKDSTGRVAVLELVLLATVLQKANQILYQGQHKASCKAKLERLITEPLHTLHMDLFGPTSVKNINHASYCLIITDDCTRFSWVFFLASKDETSGILQTFIRQIENQLSHRVKIIRSDNGTEFKNRDMLEFCGNKGIKQEYSNARTPQQNGVAERMNRTLIEAARTMLADSLLPTTFWAEAVSTACYIFNRVRVTKPQNKTPYELLFGHKPIISYIRPFGCHVTILDTLSVLGKFDGKSDEGFLVGYSLNSKAYRVYNLVTKRVEVNLHVNFLEEKPNVKGVGYRWMFDIDYLTDSMNYIPVSLENQANNAGISEETNSAGTSQTPESIASEEKDEEVELIVVPSAVKIPEEKDESRTTLVSLGDDHISTSGEALAL
ncbi:putative ribonuclease H-like domain-containing protein [Tanacetum coccineum]